MTARILMVVTSNDKMGDSGRKTGIWAEELAAPYYIFRDAGFEIDFASPLGGRVPLDPASVKPQGQNNPMVESMLADQSLTNAMANTRKTAEVKTQNYKAVFFPGGHGTMWDLANDAGTKTIVETSDRDAIPLGAVCHGVSALVSAKAKDGKPFVAGRKINSFTNAEEEAVGLTKVMPFLLETRLRDLGAKFEGAANWQAFNVEDGLLFTGQNPQSSEKVAYAVLKAVQVRTAKVA